MGSPVPVGYGGSLLFDVANPFFLIDADITPVGHAEELGKIEGGRERERKRERERRRERGVSGWKSTGALRDFMYVPPAWLLCLPMVACL